MLTFTPTGKLGLVRASRLWEELGEPGENPIRHMENMQTSQRPGDRTQDLDNVNHCRAGSSLLIST